MCPLCTMNNIQCICITLYLIARRQGPVIWMAFQNERLLDGYIITSPSGQVIMYPYTNSLSCVISFRSQATCLLAFILYLLLVQILAPTFQFIIHLWRNINIWRPAAGFAWWSLLLCFESHAHAAVACAAIFFVAKSWKVMNDIMVNLKMKSWMAARVIMWHVCEYDIKANKNWFFLLHISSIYSPPRW